jgi:hypothetical protein
MSELSTRQWQLQLRDVLDPDEWIEMEGFPLISSIGYFWQGALIGDINVTIRVSINWVELHQARLTMRAYPINPVYSNNSEVERAVRGLLAARESFLWVNNV